MHLPRVAHLLLLLLWMRMRIVGLQSLSLQRTMTLPSEIAGVAAVVAAGFEQAVVGVVNGCLQMLGAQAALFGHMALKGDRALGVRQALDEAELGDWG